MPYLISGFDSAGVPCQVTLEDDGTLTGDALLVDWLNAEAMQSRPRAHLNMCLANRSARSAWSRCASTSAGCSPTRILPTSAGHAERRTTASA